MADQLNETEGGLVPIKPVGLVEYQPDTVLTEARQVARALASIIAQKPKPVIVNGQQYLEFEDWQTVGRFYGITACIEEAPEYIEFAGEPIVQGFKAVAVALHRGEVISRATSYCLTDEDKWRTRPKFQMSSMAQTRACAKVLRNVLAWVVVLAGYKPTPAEEITEGEIDERRAAKPRRMMLRDKQAGKAPRSGSLYMSEPEAGWKPTMDEKQALMNLLARCSIETRREGQGPRIAMLPEALAKQIKFEREVELGALNQESWTILVRALNAMLGGAGGSERESGTAAPAVKPSSVPPSRMEVTERKPPAPGASASPSGKR